MLAGLGRGGCRAGAWLGAPTGGPRLPVVRAYRWFAPTGGSWVGAAPDSPSSVWRVPALTGGWTGPTASRCGRRTRHVPCRTLAAAGRWGRGTPAAPCPLLRAGGCRPVGAGDPGGPLSPAACWWLSAGGGGGPRRPPVPCCVLVVVGRWGRGTPVAPCPLLCAGGCRPVGAGDPGGPLSPAACWRLSAGGVAGPGTCSVACWWLSAGGGGGPRRPPVPCCVLAVASAGRAEGTGAFPAACGGRWGGVYPALDSVRFRAVGPVFQGRGELRAQPRPEVIGGPVVSGRGPADLSPRILRGAPERVRRPGTRAGAQSTGKGATGAVTE